MNLSINIKKWIEVDPAPLVFDDELPPDGYTGEPVLTVSEIMQRVQRGMPVPLSRFNESEQLFDSQLVDDFDALDYRESLVGEANSRARQEAASGSPGERPTQSQAAVEDFKDGPAEDPGSEIS